MEVSIYLARWVLISIRFKMIEIPFVNCSALNDGQKSILEDTLVVASQLGTEFVQMNKLCHYLIKYRKIRTYCLKLESSFFLKNFVFFFIKQSFPIIGGLKIKHGSVTVCWQIVLNDLQKIVKRPLMQLVHPK